MAIDVAAKTVAAPGKRMKLLESAAALWFAVMIMGQWVFVYYLAAFYGVTTLSGDFEAWTRHPFVKAYVPGDTIGNLSFAVHVILAIVITFGGMLQLLPQARQRAPWLHRWNGRVFLSLSILASLSGFYLVWLRQGATPEIDDLSISFNGALILLFAGLAWRTAAARDFMAHRRWALRTLMVVNGVFFLRLLFSGWIVLTQSEPSTLAFYTFEAASFLLPLALLEIYLRARDGGGPILRAVAATTLIAATGYMAIGTFAFTMIFVFGILGGASFD